MKYLAWISIIVLSLILTGREMLELFARLRGMKPQQIAEEVNYWLTEVGITEYADRKCGTYSGGNKRKLNVAQVHSVWIL